MLFRSPLQKTLSSPGASLLPPQRPAYNRGRHALVLQLTSAPPHTVAASQHCRCHTRLAAGREAGAVEVRQHPPRGQYSHHFEKGAYTKLLCGRMDAPAPRAARRDVRGIARRTRSDVSDDSSGSDSGGGCVVLICATFMAAGLYGNCGNGNCDSGQEGMAGIGRTVLGIVVKQEGKLL